MKSIRAKILLTFSLIFIFVVIAGIIMTFTGLNAIDRSRNTSNNIIIEGEINPLIKETVIELEKYYDSTGSHDLTNYQASKENLNKLFSLLDQAGISNPKSIPLYQELTQTTAKFTGLGDDLIRYIDTDDLVKASAAIDEIYSLQSYIERKSDELVSVELESLYLLQKEISNQSRRNFLIAGIIVLMVIILVFVYVIIFANNIKKSIQKIIQVADNLAKGNFRDSQLQVSAKDEIGLLHNYLNNTIKELSVLINDIKGMSFQLTDASQNLAASAEETSASVDEVSDTISEIAKGAQSQASDAEDSNQKVYALSEKIGHLNDMSKRINESAQSTISVQNEVRHAVTDLKDKTQKTSDSNLQIEKIVLSLNEKTKSIDEILNSISSIAVQTNLLALNASIEAARAGEHGRGFAVVAEEIRKLAEESNSSAEDIRNILTTIITDSTESVEAIGIVNSYSKEQKTSVENVDHSIEDISKNINLILNELVKVSSGIDEITEDKDAIVQSIDRISEVSIRTSDSTEEVNASMEQQALVVEGVAKSAEQLNEISLHLNKELSKFIID